MSGKTEYERMRKSVCIRISADAYEALKMIAEAKSGTVTSKAQELVETVKNVKAGNWHQAISAFETRGKGE